jgi:hypothetical protein
MSTPATVTIDVVWLRGDLNADRQVDRTDAARLASEFGSTAATLAQGDLDGDGLVGLRDVAVLSSQLGASMSPAAAPSPPVAFAASSLTVKASKPTRLGAIAVSRPRRPVEDRAAVDATLATNDPWLPTNTVLRAARRRSAARA